MRAAAVLVLGATVFGTGCRMNVDTQAFIEREEKRYTVSGTADLELTTFDGSIEIRSWDRPEVLVEIEKRGQDKDAVGRITVTASQKGDAITVEAQHNGRTTVIGIGHFISTSARLIVTVPATTNITARTGDGSISLDRVDGKLNLRSGDGSIKVVEAKGEVFVESGDGTLTLDDVSGHVEARTDDGSVRVSGTPGMLRVRTGDGTVSLRIRNGATMTGDWTIDTGDGSITVELPDGFNALIDADPGSDGRVRNDLELANASGPGSERRERGSLTGQLGAGGKRLTLRTGDGTIRLTKY